jgi:hypothetical protein
MGHHGVWELVFLMVILKIPIVYLCVVVVYAIRAEPRPEEGAAVTVRLGSDDSGPTRRRKPRPPRPHGRPSHTYARSTRTASTRAEAGRK